jgi:hypothetical protein
MEPDILQSDVSDSLFSIVRPECAAIDVDMGQALAGNAKDSVVQAFLTNSGTYPCRIDSIYFSGGNVADFALVSPLPPFSVAAGGSRAVEFRFAPTSPEQKIADIIIRTQAEELKRTIRGICINPQIATVNNLIDFGRIPLGDNKDSLQAITIQNAGNAPISITGTRHAAPNAIDFATLTQIAPTTLDPGDTCRMNLRFKPSAIGRTSSILELYFDGPGSPAHVQLFGEGVIPETEVTVSGSMAFCEGDSVVLSVDSRGYPVRWSNGATSDSITVRQSGTYWVEVEYSDEYIYKSEEYIVEVKLNKYEIGSLTADNILDFGTVPVGQMQAKTISLRNRSDEYSALDNIYLSRNIEFTIPPARLPVEFMPSESRGLEIYFSPLRTEIYRDTLTIEDECTIHRIFLEGRGETARLSAHAGCGFDLELARRKAANSGGISVFEPYPNPADGESVLPIYLAENKSITIEIINHYGSVVRYVPTGSIGPGMNEIRVRTEGISPGLYFYLIKSEGITSIIKLVVL